MINRQALLADLQKFLQQIEADLLERSESTEVPEVPAALHAEYKKAVKAERTAQNYEDWRTDTITQAAAAWVLSCVFVRFLEDNSLIDPPKIAGPGDRLARARDEHELYFRSHPQHTDREYLLSIFVELAKLPGTKDIFGEHNAINDLPNWLSGDAAGELLNFFQKIDASSGVLVHDFTDPTWDTRFLGDLYQDLSEAARKKFALLQTPDFVEEFILDRTLEPAIEEFGLVPQKSANAGVASARFKMIDPACGSGHFLLGAFPRLLGRWQRKEPGTNIRELAQRALDSIHGVDINPFAVAIAKFRLLLIAMQACDIRRLADAPAFHINVACGDSLLHGENRTSSGQRLWDYAEGATDDELYSHAYPGEDLRTVRSLLTPSTYHCVVANPPYIVPKDRKLNDWYRKRFSACHMKYSLAVPFMQQIFQLTTTNGFTGQITANSFMKREFGKKLIESFLPTIELTHVIDTSGAYLPGHGTPTVIMLGRSRTGFTSKIRTVMGVRGEPSTPSVPSNGLVWRAIVDNVDKSNVLNSFVSVGDADTSRFHRHPWSIGGGGAAELKESIDAVGEKRLSDCTEVIGVFGMTNADGLMVADLQAFSRRGIEKDLRRPLVTGEQIRDWYVQEGDGVLFPYVNDSLISISEHTGIHNYMWPYRTDIGNRATFSGGTYFSEGRPWWEWHQITLARLKPPLSIVFSHVGTHNHFAISEGRSVFNVHAPIIKLTPAATEEEHYDLLSILNSSLACFWMKQVFFPKGGDHVGQEGARVRRTLWDERFEFSGTGLGRFPIVEIKPSPRGRRISTIVRQASRLSEVVDPAFQTIRASLLSKRDAKKELEGMLIALQEEIDWECYHDYSLTDRSYTHPDPPKLSFGERAFEIVLARQIASGEVQSTWFERHAATPMTELPNHWPSEYKKLIERRIELIESNPSIRLIEQPEYKRRWNTEPWESQLQRALREWLLLRLETYFDFDGRMTDEPNASKRSVPLVEITMYSVAQLADAARRDSQFMEVGELYRDDPAFDVQALVEELVLAESVPHLLILRYKDSGLRKRAEWEKTWDLQRREDAMSDQLSVISDQLKAEKDEKKKIALQAELDRLKTENRQLTTSIPVPPKYTSADFISTGGARYWALRGKLDVPKERWISFPHCEGPDGTLVICWAGYDHLQQAQAISAYYVRVQTEFGGSDDPRLIPLLASLIELLPWLKQWHNEPNANFDGLRMGDYFEGFVNEEARNLGKTLAEIKAWVPPKKAAKTSSKKSKKSSDPT